jgi:hypothetical protein
MSDNGLNQIFTRYSVRADTMSADPVTPCYVLAARTNVAMSAGSEFVGFTRWALAGCGLVNSASTSIATKSRISATNSSRRPPLKSAPFW